MNTETKILLEMLVEKVKDQDKKIKELEGMYDEVNSLKVMVSHLEDHTDIYSM